MYAARFFSRKRLYQQGFSRPHNYGQTSRKNILNNYKLPVKVSRSDVHRLLYGDVVASERQLVEHPARRNLLGDRRRFDPMAILVIGRI